MEDSVGMPELRETYSGVSDVQHVAEELAVHSVISEERHDEILEETDNVCKRLDQLSAEMKTRDENLNQALVAEVTAIAVKLEAMKVELQNLKQSQATPPSLPSNGLTPEPIPLPSGAGVLPEPRIEVVPDLPPSPAPAEKRRRRI
jgi:hypothetical protein